MWVKTGFRKDGDITGHALPDLARRRRLRLLRRGLDLLHGRAPDRSPTRSRATSSRARRVFTNKPPCGPKRGHGTPQPRFALECQHRQGRPSSSASTRRTCGGATSPSPSPKTANHLTVTTIGLGECIDRVVEASGWRREAREAAAPGTRASASPAPSYMTGAGPPIYWNDMPHSGVVVRPTAAAASPCSAAPPTSARARTRSWRTSSAEVLGIAPEGHPRRHRPTPTSRRSTSARTPRGSRSWRATPPSRRRRGCASAIFAAAAQKLEVAPRARSRPATGAIFVADDRDGAVPFARGGRAGREPMHGVLGVPRLVRAAQARGQVQGRRRRARRRATRTRPAWSSWTSTRRPAMVERRRGLDRPRHRAARSIRCSSRARSRARSTWASARR